MTTHILAMGGGGFSMSDDGAATAFDRFALGLTGRERPTVCFVPTASGDSEEYVGRFEAAYAALDCETRVLELFRRRTADVRDVLDGVDLLMVGGGSTVNLMALWDVHGVSAALREITAARDLVLAGVSAGANCWFEACSTDALGPQVEAWRGGMGLLTGSFCPHYDGEEQRRPHHQHAVATGALLPGWAADDGAAVHAVDGTVVAHLAERPGARTYRVDPDGAGGVRCEPQQMRDL